MTKLFAWLGVATLMVAFAAAPARAQASEPLKPYVVFAFDTSGSMAESTGSGPPSCGGEDTRLDHARCALNKIINSYGDMTFALAHFRSTKSGTVSGTFPNGCCWNGPDIGAFGNCAAGPTCNATSDMFEMVTGLVEGQNALSEAWVNFSGNTCTTGTDPEIWQASGNTPLEGTLRGAKQYWLGLQDDGVSAPNFPVWPGPNPGFDPIRNDPTRLSFLPTGCDPSPSCTTNCCASQCRPYLVILMTDGAETCGGTPANGATSLLATDVDNRRYRVETRPIGFGIAPGNAQIEGIAHGGGAPNVAGVNEGFYASDEAGLQLAISQILDDAIRTEVCNNVDDDCDTIADEGFQKGVNCNNGRLGRCLVNGMTACRADGTGTECSAGVSACAGRVLNQACTVTNAAGTSVAGTCQAGNPQLVCVPTPQSEPPLGCNNLDDDCDGLIDEGVTGCTCVPSTEICDGINNDCDGQTDEGTDVACGTGTCLGIRDCQPFPGCNPSPTCTGPTCCLAACDADTPGTEVCNGVDDNCDGNADGFQEACSNMFCPGGACTGGVPGQRTCVGGARDGQRCDTFTPDFDPRNNPGGNPASPCRTMSGAACICNPGSRTCPLNGSGMFSACTGEVEPATEICNNLDDDCDGLIDEAPPVTCTNDSQCPPITPTCDNPTGMPSMGTCEPADCSINSCGGELLCVNGSQMCTQTTGTDDTCNGIDEDCDMMVDEHWECDDPDGPDNIPGNADDCPCTAGGQCNAHESCQNGSVVCMGDPVAQESCNCADDDCDGMTDEGSLCGTGATCTNCQCAFACSPGEFPCPMGKICINQFCVADPCFGVTCPTVPGDKQICRPNPQNPASYQCLSACDPSVITCADPLICYLPEGQCRPDDCSTFPEYCNQNENCINGVCMSNPCQGVTCPAGEYCNNGQCYGSCATVECPEGQRCRLGTCEDDPCDEGCPFGMACHDETGQCVDNPCGMFQCPQGQWCNPNNNGMCEDDPCAIFDIQCAEGEVCLGGTCYDPADFRPDAGVEQHVTTGGGGGCSAGGEASLLVGLALLLRPRRRRGGALAGGAS